MLHTICEIQMPCTAQAFLLDFDDEFFASETK